MAHFEDLSDCQYLPGSDGLGFLAVGWLQLGEDYEKGAVSEEFFEKLLNLLQNPWTPPIAVGGVHLCDLCKFSGGRARFDCHFGETSLRRYNFSGVGDGFLFVPHGNDLFVSPSNIAHYIDAHQYCPPSRFQQAVLVCPEMQSSAFSRSLLCTPAREWLRRLKAQQK